MALPNIIMWAIVLAVGVPSAWRNPTAGALVLCWVVSEGIYAFTGNGLAVEYYIFPDVFVLAIIFAKPEACDLAPYADWRHQLKCFLLERSVPDRIVMLIFPVMWCVYVSGIDPYYQWWSLWGLAIIQFFAAGWEGFSKIYRSRAVSETPDRSSGDVFRRLAWSWDGG
jgi:hypothetical protein